MGTRLHIAEVFRRSGFTPPTLRYYEQVGLLPPPDRTAAGYRSYDEAVLDRLALIARAKQLGFSLEEIAGLLADWDEGRCAPVQERLRALAAVKLDEAQARTAEVQAHAGELRRVIATLGSHTPDGPCDDQCGCVTAPPPDACTLEPDEMPARLRDWHGVLARVTSRTSIDGGVRLSLDAATPVDELTRLVTAEQACCAFFAFAITVDGRGLALEVRAPADAQPVLKSLFA